MTSSPAGAASSRRLALLREAGLVAHDAVTLIDRQEGGRAALKAMGINLVSILTLEQIANYLRYSGRIEAPDHERIVRYIHSRQDV